MKIYTVHLRRHGLNPDQDLVLVGEGFSWAAGILSLLWALWHRMWWVAAGLVALNLGLNGLVWLLGLNSITSGVLSLGLAVLTGLLGNDLRRWTLDRQGFADCGVVSGLNLEQAMARYLDGAPEIAREIA